jgi:ABC-type antimicrobial peptide transport system permease subunit
MSFAVSQRRREIGIRAALGASSIDVLRSVFSRVALQVGIGVALGLLGAILLAPLSDDAVLAERLAMVTPAIALIMVVVGVVAAYGPARRSLRIQPTEAVRSE